MRKTILIADDHPVYLLGLRTLLQTRSDRYLIVHEAFTVDELMAKLAQQAVDIIITDLSMPGSRHPDGLTMVQTLRRHFPQSMIVVITMMSNPELLASLRRCGVHAVLSKNSLSQNLLKTLHSSLVGRIAPAEPKIRLTERELEVLRLLMQGMTVNQIGEYLNRTKQTISTQKISAMRKLGVTTNFELFQCMQDMGLSC